MPDLFRGIREQAAPYNDLVALFYEWYEITRDERGRERRRKLRWRMTIPDLIAHGQRPEHLGKVFEMVPNSEERRGDGGYSGYGQYLKDLPP